MMCKFTMHSQAVITVSLSCPDARIRQDWNIIFGQYFWERLRPQSHTRLVYSAVLESSSVGGKRRSCDLKLPTSFSSVTSLSVHKMVSYCLTVSRLQVNEKNSYWHTSLYVFCVCIIHCIVLSAVKGVYLMLKVFFRWGGRAQIAS